MDETLVQETDVAPAPVAPQPGPVAPRRTSWRATLSFRRLSAVYIFVVLFAVFAVWVPDTFLAAGTWRSILDGQALTALAAVALMIPVAAGAFTLAIGAQIGLTSIFAAWLLVDQAMPAVPAVLLTLLVGAVVGGITALLVAVARIDSFIATLGVSSVLVAGVNWLSGGAQILNLPSDFSAFSTERLLGVTSPVVIMLIVAMAVWYVVENTPVGRRLHATGGNEPAARLAGVRTRVVIAGSLVTCGLLSALVGILLASRLGTGDPTSGPSFLLPAFSAVFLGATQFRAGRYNVWGTVVAVYVLAGPGDFLVHVAVQSNERLHAFLVDSLATRREVISFRTQVIYQRTSTPVIRALPPR